VNDLLLSLAFVSGGKSLISWRFVGCRMGLAVWILDVTSPYQLAAYSSH